MTQTRITAACPEAMLDDANHLAMALGPSEEETIHTYGGLGWQDAEGNLYAGASFEAPPEWIAAAQSPLVRPAWDVPDEQGNYVINMAWASEAQAAMVFWSGQGSIPQAAPAILVAVGGMSGPAALEAMGLTRVPSEI